MNAEARDADVERFIDQVLDRGDRGRLVRLGPVRNAVAIKNRLGIDVSRFGRGLNANDVAHVVRRHGADPTPITRSDLASYRRWADSKPIIAAYPSNARGRPASITYAFEESGYRYNMSETINSQARLITLKTMRKVTI
jgi:hypothetical protein